MQKKENKKENKKKRKNMFKINKSYLYTSSNSFHLFLLFY